MAAAPSKLDRLQVPHIPRGTWVCVQRTPSFDLSRLPGCSKAFHIQGMLPIFGARLTAMLRTSLVAGLLSLLLPAPALWALCQYPQPRLVCAETTYSNAVVIAQVERAKYIPNKNDVDVSIYTLRLEHKLRGKISPVFRIKEPNDSGRAPFYWRAGKSYLLFLNNHWYPGYWAVDGCGNSGPLNKSKPVLAAVEKTLRSHRDPLLSGQVTTDSWTTGIADVLVTVRSKGKVIHLTTSANGRFQLHVPSGTYTVSAQLHGRPIPPNPLSYENPRLLNLKRGTCTQVAFAEH